MDDAPVAEPVPGQPPLGPALTPTDAAGVIHLFGKTLQVPGAVNIGLAALQVILVCGIPTQILVFVAFMAAGQPVPLDDTHVPLQFFAMFSLFDTALVALLIRVFLGVTGETSRDVFLGRSPLRREAWLGLALLPVVFVVIQGLVFGLGKLLPWLHNVPKSPLQDYMGSPLEAGIFIVVVVLAGGVREELQRAFVLHRFKQHLGGAWLGLALFSVLFGALHLTQGYDAALAVGLLGLLWGILYIRRRSAVASIVNHASFDAAQVLLQLLAKTYNL